MAGNTKGVFLLRRLRRSLQASKEDPCRIAEGEHSGGALIQHANAVLTRWVRFYNQERIHSGVGYISPAEYLQRNNVSLPQELTTATQFTNFSIN